jgi:hypothetical protein
MRLSGWSFPVTCALTAAALGPLIVTLAIDRPAPRRSGIEDLLGPRANTPAPSSDGTCHFDLTGTHAIRVFFVLGMLNEYLERHIAEDDDLIEAFYPRETKEQDLFARELAALASEQHLDVNVPRSVLEQGHVEFRSVALAERINSCYRYRLSSELLALGADGWYRRTANATLDRRLFLVPGEVPRQSEDAIDRSRALAYVAGAWVRYGASTPTPVFRFANAHKKARLLVELLRGLGCENVCLFTRSDVVPNGNAIYFQPTEELKRWLSTAIAPVARSP